MTDSISQTPTTLVLCRHGESEWNVEGRIQGQSSLAGGLTDLGRRQAQRLGERLRNAGLDQLYTSDLRRALETAAIVGAALGLQPQLDHRWRELDLGDWHGLTGAEVEARWPEQIAALRRGEDVPRGNGETFARLQARTLAAITDLAQRHPGQTVGVICHGGNVRAALLLLPTPDPSENQPDQRSAPIPNTSVTILRVAADNHLQALAVVDASHLDGLATDGEDNRADEQR